MPAPRKDYSKAVELYHAGWAVSDLADRYCITRQAMHAILTRRGVVFPPNQIYRTAKVSKFAALQEAADKVVISNATGNEDLFLDAVRNLLAAVRSLDARNA